MKTQRWNDETTGHVSQSNLISLVDNRLADVIGFAGVVHVGVKAILASLTREAWFDSETSGQLIGHSAGDDNDRRSQEEDHLHDD